MGSVKTYTTLSLIMATNLLTHSGHTVSLHQSSGPYTHWNREHLVRLALEHDDDYVMFVDTDVIFETDAIIRLLGAEKPVIAGPYNLKQDEPMSTIKLDDGNGGYKAATGFPFPEDPFEVAAIGTGFMLIHKAVFAAINPPYFPCDFNGGDGTEVGEDIAFCRKVRAAGLTIWCHPKAQCGHIGDRVY